jgi:hypothetical protein
MMGPLVVVACPVAIVVCPVVVVAGPVVIVPGPVVVVSGPVAVVPSPVVVVAGPVVIVPGPVGALRVSLASSGTGGGASMSGRGGDRLMLAAKDSIEGLSLTISSTLLLS